MNAKIKRDARQSRELPPGWRVLYQHVNGGRAFSDAGYRMVVKRY